MFSSTLKCHEQNINLEYNLFMQAVKHVILRDFRIKEESHLSVTKLSKRNKEMYLKNSQI